MHIHSDIVLVWKKLVIIEIASYSTYILLASAPKFYLSGMENGTVGGFRRAGGQNMQNSNVLLPL